MITRSINQVYNHFGYLIRTAVITGVDEGYTYCDLYCTKEIKRATGHRFPHGDEPFEPLTQEERVLFNPVEDEEVPVQPPPAKEKPKSSPTKSSRARGRSTSKRTRKA